MSGFSTSNHQAAKTRRQTSLAILLIASLALHALLIVAFAHWGRRTSTPRDMLFEVDLHRSTPRPRPKPMAPRLSLAQPRLKVKSTTPKVLSQPQPEPKVEQPQIVIEPTPRPVRATPVPPRIQFPPPRPEQVPTNAPPTPQPQFVPTSIPAAPVPITPVPVFTPQPVSKPIPTAPQFAQRPIENPTPQPNVVPPTSTPDKLTKQAPDDGAKPGTGAPGGGAQGNGNPGDRNGTPVGDAGQSQGRSEESGTGTGQGRGSGQDDAKTGAGDEGGGSKGDEGKGKGTGTGDSGSGSGDKGSGGDKNGTGTGNGDGTGNGKGNGSGDGNGDGNGGSGGDGNGGNGNGNGSGNGGRGGNGGGNGGMFGLPTGGSGPRHIVYLLDISSSMIMRLARAKQELRAALKTLQPNESFNIIAFFADIQGFSFKLEAATPENIARANAFVDRLELQGGTNFEKPLKMALSLPGVNVVQMVTDGDPTQGETNHKKLTRLIQKTNRSRARIFTIGLVGRNPDGKDRTFESVRLLKQISQDSNGESIIYPLG